MNICHLQAVGDAISGILLVEAALRRRSWGLADWAALYDDLPSRQLQVISCSFLPQSLHGFLRRAWGLADCAVSQQAAAGELPVPAWVFPSRCSCIAHLALCLSSPLLPLSAIHGAHRVWGAGFRRAVQPPWLLLVM